MKNLLINVNQSCAASNAKRLGELIYSTDTALQDFLFNATGEPLNAIAKLAASDKGFFSHKIVHAAFHLEELVGACFCFKPETYAELLEECLGFVEKAYGRRVAVEVKHSLRQILEITPPFPKSALYLQNLAVVPSHRNQGVGSKLFSSVLNQSAAKGVDICVLDVCSKNATAIKFYQSFSGRIENEWSGLGLGLRNYFRMHIPILAAAS